MKIKIPGENRDVRAAIRGQFLKELAIIAIWCAAVSVAGVVTHSFGSGLSMAFIELLWLYPIIRLRF